MMTEHQRIEWLLELQDHPEQITDAQMLQILANDEMRQLVNQLGLAKRAFKHDALKNDTPDVDAEWEIFAATHAGQLEAFDEEKPKHRFLVYLFTHKTAASFIGVLLASGIAFAAIKIVHNINTPKQQQTETTKQVAERNINTGKQQTDKKENATEINSFTPPPSDMANTDTIPTMPYVFNNVPLDSMIIAIADYYQVGVEFKNDATRGLRFHFVWKREDSLARVVEKLNTFEAVNIGLEDKKLVVR